MIKWEPSQWPPHRFTFSLRNVRTATKSEFTLGTAEELFPPVQIDEMDIVNDRSLLILGRIGANYPTAAIIELPSGRILDRFSCFMPVVSPDHRFVAFLKTFPGHPGPVSVNAEYLVYDLTQSPAYNRPHFKAGVTYDAGWPIYPAGATNALGSNLVPGLASPVHWIASAQLFWLDKKTLALVDHYPGEERLVAANLSRGVQAPTVHTEMLDAGELTDLQRCSNAYSAEDFKNMSRDPSGLIRVRQISPAPKKPGYVCLRLEPGPCLTRTELTLKLP